jgi:hypothetical protein
MHSNEEIRKLLDKDIVSTLQWVLSEEEPCNPDKGFPSDSFFHPDESGESLKTT